MSKDYEQNTKTDAYVEFQSYQSWLQTMQIPEVIKKNTEMYEGEQWAKATERTENMPRPVFNAYAYLLNTKLGNILANPMKVNYISTSTRDISNKFTRVSEYLRKEAHEDDFDFKIAKESLLKGTGFKYYHYNENAIGLKGEYKGGIRIELIDIMDIAFANPTIKDIQKQKWIIIRSRVEEEVAKELCANKSQAEFIHTDDVDNSVYDDVKELEGSKYVYIYTKMIKKDGEVWFSKSTDTVLLHDFKPLNPRLIEKEISKKEKEGMEEDTMQDSDLERENQSDSYKAFLYPVNSLTFKEKDKRIIGIPEFNDIIEAQKGINSNYGIGTLNNLQVACPKYVAKENALQGQVITNKVGETIIDHTPQGTQGIYILSATPMTQGALALAPNSLELLKVIKGANDVISGEVSSSDLSGYAISQLSAQAQKPIALLQKALWRHKEREAEIFRQFIILFYNDEAAYRYKNTDIEMNEQSAISGGSPQEYTVDKFIGNEFENFEFDVQVEVGAGTQYSEIQTMSQLDNLLGGGFIDFPTYIECYPDKAMSFKQTLKDAIRQREASEVVQLRNQVQELSNNLQQVSQYAKSLEQQTNEQKRALDDSQRYVKALQNEYTTKINQANKAMIDYVNQQNKNQEQVKKVSK